MSNRVGRPSKLTPETQARFLEALRLGTSYEGSAAFAGISYRCFRNWMLKGESQKTGGYVQFFQEVKKAEGQAEVKWLAKIEKAASEGQWTAAAWKLERRFPDRWAKREHITHERIRPPEVVEEYTDPWLEEDEDSEDVED